VEGKSGERGGRMRKNNKGGENDQSTLYACMELSYKTHYFVQKKNRAEGRESAQVVKFLPCKCETLSANLSTTTKKKKKKTHIK
jgi:hypothetical protein